MKKRYLAYFFIPVLLLLVYPLLTGSEMLLYPLTEKPYLPLGTLYTWLLFILLPLTIKWLSKNRNIFTNQKLGYVFHMLLGVGFWMGLIWPFVSFVLSENMSFSFTSNIDYFELRSTVFWSYAFTTVGILLLAIFLLLIAILIKLLSGSHQAKNP